MATQNTPITYIFKETNIGKYTSVKHYEFVSFNGTTNHLSTQLNISKNRNCAQSTPNYWLKIKQGKKWGSWLTGLFKTSSSNIFRGDLQKKKHLLLFKFSNDAETLKVCYFENYFTTDLSNVLQFIK
ncbi:hypothetical protein [Polaribacter glomeratus]|uniref:Uncharacterized protein n=1 Tax=Polaribacter glomeratus TaxID=102 RepID=A0A2S7WYM9_9FLAO|nr:hypothetical protein [Polaribacter glomeratus]PQJ82626.1 hypothetical protein BTO16_08570 [Polaribacter glomeratus]TXD64918.1 hypothetical protein ESX12_12295 [Polaribacter glomeratus]